MNFEQLDLMEQTAVFVSTLTGMKTQLVNQGWSEDHAEEIIVTFLKQGLGGPNA